MDFNYKEISDKILKFINTSNKDISILVHKNTDGDCIGAGLGLGLWLNEKGFNAKIISSNKISECFFNMPNAMNILIYDSIFKDTIVKHIQKSNLIFCLDFSQKSRIDNDLVKLISEDNKNIFVIDHHLEKSEFNGINCINPHATSTCEMLYEIIKNIDIETITKDIAISFYLGIMTDTCKFTTPNVTYHTHEIIAEILKRHDIDISKIQNLIFNNNSPTKIHFLGYILLKRLKIITNYNTAYMMITKEDYTKFRLRTGDTDGIVNYGLSLKDVFFTAMFNEKKDGIYISFRSIGNFPVNDFAKTYFNGGGHKNAAGGFSNMTLKETVKNFVNIIKSLKNIKDGYQ